MALDPSDRDEELLKAALVAPEGDLRAFEQLVQLHRKRIHADCRYLTRDENNAEDLAQEVFVKAYFALRGFEGRSSFRHWLQRIKVNHCLNHLKKQEGKGNFAIEDPQAESLEQLQVPPTAESNLQESESQREVAGILDAMPPTLRVPLVMSDMDEMSYQEIADSLGISLSAVKMRIKRAREQFRRLYQGVEAAEDRLETP